MTTITKTNRYLKALGILVAPAVLAAGLLAASAAPAHAATTFTVDSTSDFEDFDLNDSVCDGSPLPGVQCTLRAAIEESNFTVGADTIKFDIPGGGVKTIKPASELPRITDKVTINGYSQPGSSPNTLAEGTNAKIMVEIDGATAEGNNNDGRGDDTLDGLKVKALNTTIKGLAIHSFLGDGIEIAGRDNTTGVKVQGNFIGTTPGGTIGRGGNGVRLEPVDRSFPGPRGNTIGGSAPAARNLISANLGSGVSMLGSDDNVVAGNLIGTKKDGTSALGNSFSGVGMFASSNNTVGGTSAGSANTIAFNGQDGVSIASRFDSDTGNRVLRNSIFSNGGIGIDLSIPLRDGDDFDGPTANDPGDADSGPNNLQNKPVISSARTGGDKTTIEGTLNSTPNKSFRIQFFSKPFGADPDPEGKDFVGEKTVSTNASGNATFTFQPANAVPKGNAVTATATTGGNTSEFSAPKTVVFGGTLEPSTQPEPNLEPSQLP